MFPVSNKKSFNRHKLPHNRIPQNMCPATSRLTSPADQGGQLDTKFEEMQFLGSLYPLTLSYKIRKTYKTS